VNNTLILSYVAHWFKENIMELPWIQLLINCLHTSVPIFNIYLPGSF